MCTHEHVQQHAPGIPPNQQHPGLHPPCSAAALGAIEVLQGVEASTLLAEALVHTVTDDAADLQGHSTAQHVFVK
jgi:hypothetical protein